VNIYDWSGYLDCEVFSEYDRCVQVAHIATAVSVGCATFDDDVIVVGVVCCGA
jgi:hypothetical protein